MIPPAHGSPSCCSPSPTKPASTPAGGNVVLTVIPGAETDALTAMTQLLHRREWRDSAASPAMLAELTARLNAPEPYLRQLAVTALPVIYPDPADRASAIASHVDTEDNLDVLDAALHVANDTLSPDG